MRYNKHFSKTIMLQPPKNRAVIYTPAFPQQSPLYNNRLQVVPLLGNCEEELPKKPVGRLSVVCWPTVGRLLADCWPSVG